MNAPYSVIGPEEAGAVAEIARPPAQDDSSRTIEQTVRRSAFEPEIIMIS
jgi:hypothetical protein